MTKNAPRKSMTPTEFVENNRGDISDEEFKSAVDFLSQTQNKYYVRADIVAYLWAIKLSCYIDEFINDKKWTCEGSGGISAPTASGVYWGHVFTSDITNLLNNTKSFQINGVGLYVNINFFDEKSHLIGHLQAGGLSVNIPFAGGGAARWFSRAPASLNKK